VRGGKVFKQIIKQRAKPMAFVGDGHCLLDKLGLTPIAMRGHDQPTRHLVGRHATIIPSHQVQAQVDPRRASGRGEHITVIDIQHIRRHLNGRITLLQHVSVPPVGRGLPVVEQPCGGQHKDARADREDPRPTRMGGNQLLAQCGGDRDIRAPPAGDDNGPGFRQQLQPAVNHQPDAARGAQCPRFDPRHCKAIPVIPHFRACKAENFHGNAEFKRA